VAGADLCLAGVGIPKDAAKAEDLLEQGCGAGDDRACQGAKKK
jgi:hypothetical protein